MEKEENFKNEEESYCLLNSKKIYGIKTFINKNEEALTEIEFKNTEKNELRWKFVSRGNNIYYFKGSSYHRENNKPAISMVNGYKEYRFEGVLHRNGDLPAVIDPQWRKEYWLNGQRYRENGLPAVTYNNKDVEYWCFGSKVSKETSALINVLNKQNIETKKELKKDNEELLLRIDSLEKMITNLTNIIS